MSPTETLVKRTNKNNRFFPLFEKNFLRHSLWRNCFLKLHRWIFHIMHIDDSKFPSLGSAFVSSVLEYGFVQAVATMKIALRPKSGEISFLRFWVFMSRALHHEFGA
jgi:hypothetical protein